MIQNKWMVFILLLLLPWGCASTDQRAKEIKVQQPQWNQATVTKLAERKVEVGMNKEMVVAALGVPAMIVREGGVEKWSYAVMMERGQGDLYEKYVYFVYLKDDKVVKTSGDWSSLGYWNR
jgi:outer membrane protein assembly factor BamE (lipoprotein component of BamABCDE complex)